MKIGHLIGRGTLLTSAFSTAMIIAAPHNALANNVTWGGTAGAWDTTTANWTGDSTFYTEGDNVTFGAITANRIITIQPGGVTPASMLLNNTGFSYAFTGGSILGGTLTQTTNVTATFNSNASHGFSSVNIEQGTLSYDPTAADLASILPSYSFGAGSINLGTGATAGTFQMRGNQNALFTLNNSFGVNAGNGTIVLGASAQSPSFKLTGDITLNGNLTINTTRPAEISGPISLVGGTRRITFNNSHNTPDFAYTQLSGNISGSNLFELSQNGATQFRGTVVSGNNTGLTGGIAVHNRGIVIFNSLNAMGGGGIGSVNVNNNTYAGFDFANFGGSSASGTLSLISTASAGNLGLEADSSANIDLTGYNTNIRLGSATQATYSGTLTPQAAEYKLGGGGGHLTVSSILTGARTLTQGNVANVPASITTLTGANDYTGTTTVASGILNVAAGGTLGSGNVSVSSGAALSLGSGAQINPSANLTFSAGGGLILNNMSWASYIAGRSGSGTTNDPTIYAARGADVTVTSGNFDRNFTLGFTQQRDSDGTVFADHIAVIAQNITLTADRTITVASTGPGLIGSWDNGRAQRISGNISGAFVPLFTGGGDTRILSEIVLAGGNTWTGSAGAKFNGIQAFNVGAGGYLNAPNGATGQGGIDTFIRFDGNSSLPTGNAGGTAYIATFKGLSGGQEGRQGILLTTSVAGETYNLPTGYRFVLGGIGNRGHNSTFGASSNDGTAGTATLRKSDIAFHWGHIFSTQTSIDGLSEDRPLNMLVREGALFLGTTGAGPNDGAVRFIPVISEDVAVSATATTLLHDTRNGHYLNKRGEGTLVLQNVAYTQVDGSGNTAGQFVWNIGRNSGGNSGANAYFDGAVRGLSFSDAGANSSNSLVGHNLRLRGGVYEIDNTSGNSGTFTATVGSGVGSVGWGTGGGGFSAYGGPVNVTLSTAETGREWQDSNFLGNNESLIFGSYTANNVINWTESLPLANATNATVNREIRVIDNPNSGGDFARISGNILDRAIGQAAGTGTRSLTKTGLGTLVLAGTANDYNGTTAITSGTFVVGDQTSPTAAITGVGGQVSVLSGATLGGHGSISRDVLALAGSIVAPGTSPGSLELASTFDLQANAMLKIELAGDSFTLNATEEYDRLKVGGLTTLAGQLNVTLISGHTLGQGDLYGIVDAVGGLSGLFSNYNEGDLVLANSGVNLFITYQGLITDSSVSVSGGNDVVLFAVIPEPATAVVLALGGLMMISRRRRRTA